MPKKLSIPQLKRKLEQIEDKAKLLKSRIKFEEEKERIKSKRR